MKNAGLMALAALAAALVMSAVPAEAHQLSLTAANGSIVMDPHTSRGVFSWTVNGVNHLFQEASWLRIGDSDPESPLSSLSLVHHHTGLHVPVNEAHLIYQGSGLSVTVRYRLESGTGGVGEGCVSQMTKTVTIANTSEAPLDVRWFEYTDFDMDGTFSADDAEYLPFTYFPPFFFIPPRIAQREKSVSIVMPITPGADAWEIAPFADILRSLDDASPTSLANMTSPLSGDMTNAFQYNFDGLPPGGDVQVVIVRLVYVCE